MQERETERGWVGVPNPILPKSVAGGGTPPPPSFPLLISLERLFSYSFSLPRIFFREKASRRRSQVHVY